MSGSKDNLKDMFTEAFAAEQIPVDMGAWNQMETLLNKRKPFGLAYWALLPLLLVLSGLGSWYGFSNVKDAIYTPRANYMDLNALGIIGECDGESGTYKIDQPKAKHMALANAIEAPITKVEKQKNASTSMAVAGKKVSKAQSESTSKPLSEKNDLALLETNANDKSTITQSTVKAVAAQNQPFENETVAGPSASDYSETSNTSIESAESVIQLNSNRENGLNLMPKLRV